MENFSMYYMRRRLEGLGDEVLSEGVEAFDHRAFVRKNKSKSALDRHVRKFSDGHPSLQRCDVEDAVLAALKEVSKKKPSTEESAKRLFGKQVKSLLGKVRRAPSKNLSCLKAIKSSKSDLERMVSRAGKILTSNERRALDLCSDGHPVRKIGEMMGVSFPTAWRILNSAIDKVRISHGMKSRHKDRR